MPDLHAATATLRRLVHQTQNRNDFEPGRTKHRPSLDAYQDLLEGTTRSQDTATLALPALPLLGGRRVNSIWPASPRPASPDASPGGPSSDASVAPALNTVTAGDPIPDLKSTDGIQLSFSGQPGAVYTLLQTRGMRLNGAFSSWGDRQNSLERLGLLLMTPDGYSRIEIGARNDGRIQTDINGTQLQPGQSARLADGGLLHVARNERHIYIRSPLHFTATIEGQQTNSTPLLGLRLQKGAVPAETQQTRFEGLLAPGFLGPSRPRYMTHSGENYPGSLEELRVTSGLYGPSSLAPQNGFTPSDTKLGSIYEHYFGLSPELSHLDLQAQDIAEQWQWINQQAVQLDLIQNAAARERKLREQERKQELLLAAALKGGNIDLAILLLSATETQNANDLTRRLVLRIHQLQKQRQTLSAQMAQVDQTDGAAGSSQLQSLVTQASNIGTEISLLQTFLQEAVASKRNIQEFASNWIQQSYQTTRSIIQSIGR